MQAYKDVGIRAYVCPLIGDQPIDSTVALGCGLRGNRPPADPQKTDQLIAFMERAIEVKTLLLRQRKMIIDLI
jgi:hypothetical protein